MRRAIRTFLTPLPTVTQHCRWCLGSPTDPEAVTLTALSASKVLRGVVTPTPTPTPAPPQTPPYGFYFARAAILVGLIAYVATVIALVAFTAELDSAAVTGSLGVLFTL